jgi:hypothetical protein
MQTGRGRNRDHADPRRPFARIDVRRSGGRDFDEADETKIHELAALVGEMLNALRLAAQQPA